jgi:glyceraldehyde-3-phosphate dehydrogenase/erythrose-4-phosphate dehydrogenase
MHYQLPCSVAKVMNDKWGITKGVDDYYHSYTNESKVQDMAHSDLRAPARQRFP